MMHRSFWSSLIQGLAIRSNNRKRAGHVKRRCSRPWRPILEALEDRQLPSWIPLGPAPQQDTKNVLSTNWQGPNVRGFSLSGRVTALAQAGGAMYLGTADGGVWKSTNFQTTNPALVTWTPLTDYQGLFSQTADLISPGIGTGALAVGSIATDPNHPQKIYVGTGEANQAGDNQFGTGVLISNDGGSSWTLSTGPDGAFIRESINKIFVDPTDASGQTLYAAVTPSGIPVTSPVAGFNKVPNPHDGIYRSVDGGLQWTKVSGSLALESGAAQGDNVAISDLDYTVSADNSTLTLYAAVGFPEGSEDNGIFKGTLQADGSIAWGGQLTMQEPTLPGNPLVFPADLGRILLAADHTPGNGLVYAAVSNAQGLKIADEPGIVDLFKCTDGATFNGVGFDLQGNYAGGGYYLALALAPDGRVYLGGVTEPPTPTDPADLGVWVFRPGATQWNAIDEGTNDMGPHTDGHAFGFGSDGTGNSTFVYYGTDGGIFRYTASAGGLPVQGIWQTLNNAPLQTTLVNSVSLDPSNPNVIVGGTQDNALVRSTDGGITWNTFPAGGDIGQVQIARGWGPVLPGAINQPTPTFAWSEDGTFLSRDTGDGKGFQQIAMPNAPAFSFSTPFAVDPAMLRVALPAKSGVVYESENAAYAAPVQWGNPISPSLIVSSETDRINAMAYSYDGNVLYVGTLRGALYRGQRGKDDNWTWSSNIQAYWGIRRIRNIAVDPADSKIVYIGLGDPLDGTVGTNYVWQTRNAGASWTSIGDGLPSASVGAVVLDKDSAGNPILYIGNGQGVYRGIRNGGTWAWARFQGGPLNSDPGGLPNVEVDGLQIRKYDGANGINEVLVAATYGRGIWEISLGTGVQENLNPAGKDLHGREGAQSSDPNDPSGNGTFVDGTLATFTPFVSADDSNPPDDTEAYAATIDWGDGTSSEGEIVDNGDGTFGVLGSHLYSGAEEQTYDVTVTVASVYDADNAWDLVDDPSFEGQPDLPVRCNSHVVIDDASLHAGSVDSLAVVQGVPFSQIIGSFTDENAFATSNDFMAIIDWGDGTQSAGAIEDAGSGSFAVIGTHAYGSPGGYQATVSILDDGGSATQTAGSVWVLSQTNTSLSSWANPSVYGQSVIFTAKVTGNVSMPTGTVFFADEDGTLGSAAPDAYGNAVFSISTLMVGDHTLIATYAGDSNNAASSGSVTQSVDADETSTTITSSVNPTVYGQAVTFTATVAVVAPGTAGPTGTVTFDADGAVLGIVQLTSGQASLTTSLLTVGDRTITASYSGDANCDGSEADLAQAINPDPTTTSVTSSLNPLAYGQSVTFTAAVTATAPGAGTPTGTIDFSDNSEDLGTVTLVNGQAVLIVSSLAAGTHNISATYSSDPNFMCSVGTIVETVNQDQTTVTLVSGPDPSMYGEDVTLTATVVAVAPGTAAPTGMVEFMDGQQSLGSGVIVSGQASLVVSDLAVGDHNITALYSGDPNCAASTSDPTAQTVNADTTVTTLSSDADPSVYGDTITLTASVAVLAPGTAMPSGTVVFEDENGILGTATVDSTGTATLSVSTLTGGDHTITAVYLGDDNTAESGASITQVVEQQGTAMTLTTSLDPSVYGQPVTLTATVLPANSGTPTGIVDFVVNGTVIGSAAVDSSGVATLTTADLPEGTDSVVAVYAGDQNYIGSSAVWSQEVDQDQTTVSLTTSDQNGSYGETVTVTATVGVVAPGAGTPGGTVTFMSGGTVLGTVTVDANGQATLTLPAWQVGNYSITGIYNGDGESSTSTAPPVSQSIGQAQTHTTVTSSLNPSTSGQSVTFTALVALAAGSGTIGGTVTFMDGNTVLATVNVDSSGHATFTTSSLSVGTHNITAVFSGDGNTLGSSGSVTQTVNGSSGGGSGGGGTGGGSGHSGGGHYNE